MRWMGQWGAGVGDPEEAPWIPRGVGRGREVGWEWSSEGETGDLGGPVLGRCGSSRIWWVRCEEEGAEAGDGRLLQGECGGRQMWWVRCHEEGVEAGDGRLAQGVCGRMWWVQCQEEGVEAGDRDSEECSQRHPLHW